MAAGGGRVTADFLNRTHEGEYRLPTLEESGSLPPTTRLLTPGPDSSTPDPISLTSPTQIVFLSPWHCKNPRPGPEIRTLVDASIHYVIVRADISPLCA